MKSILSFCLLFATATLVLRAQQTVSAGAGYADEVYFSLASGVVGTASLDEWDIGIEVAAGFSASIITNDGKGVVLYSVPTMTAGDFGNAVDTNGLSESWDAWYNSTATWDQGAFNMDSDPETGNFGWGEYSLITHTVSGTTLFVIVLPDGTAKQVAIEGLASGTYTMLIAELDGSDQKTITVAKSDYANRQFAYYSIANNEVMDREPNAFEWDLVFGKYIEKIGPDSDIPYSVFGVRSAPGTSVAKVETDSPASVAAPTDSASYSFDINTIGYDWKTFTGSGWSFADVAFFVKDRDENIYRLYFTDFTGSGEGTSTFELELLGTSSVSREETVVAEFGLYPNILRSGNDLSCVYNLASSASEVTFRLFDMNGQLVYSKNLSSSAGFFEQRMNLDLPSGRYQGVLEVDGAMESRPVIVQ